MKLDCSFQAYMGTRIYCGLYDMCYKECSFGHDCPEPDYDEDDGMDFEYDNDMYD